MINSYKNLCTMDSIIEIPEDINNYKDYQKYSGIDISDLKTFYTTITKNKSAKINLLNEQKKIFASLKTGKSYFADQQIIAYSKMPRHLNKTILNDSQMFNFNTFYCGTISFWKSAIQQDKPVRDYAKLIIDEKNQIIAFTHKTKSYIPQFCTYNSQYAYLFFNNQHNLKFVFTEQPNEYLEKQHKHCLNMIQFTNDIIIHSLNNISQEDIRNDFTNKLHYMLTANIDADAFVTNTVYRLKYKQSWSKSNIRHIQQITIDVDFHDAINEYGDLDLDRINQLKQNLIKTMETSLIRPSLMENSLRGLHFVYRFTEDLDIQKAKLLSATIRFYLQHFHKIQDVDNQATDLNRLTREVLGFQRKCINEKTYQCVNYPIFWNKHSYDIEHLLNFLLNYAHEHPVDYKIMCTLANLDTCNDLDSLSEKQKQQIRDIINANTCINTKQANSDISPLVMLSQQDLAQSLSQDSSQNLSLNHTNKIEKNLGKDINSKEQKLLNQQIIIEQKELFNQLQNASAEEQVKIKQKLRILTYKSMLINPLIKEEFKSNLLKAVYDEDWPAVASIIHLPVVLDTPKEIDMNYCYRIVQSKFKDIIGKIFSSFAIDQTISSPLYTDKTPSFKYSQKRFDHFSGKPSGDMITLMSWIIISKHLTYYSSLSIEDGLHQVTAEAILTLAKALKIPVKEYNGAFTKIDNFLDIYEQTKTNPEITNALINVDVNYERYYFTMNRFQKSMFNMSWKEIEEDFDRYEQAIKERDLELTDLYNNIDYINAVKHNNELPVNMDKYIEFANELTDKLDKYHNFNSKKMNTIVNFIIKFAFAQIYKKYAFNSGKDNIKNFYAGQVQLFTNYLAHCTRLSLSTIKAYTRYLFMIGFFNRQVNIYDIDETSYVGTKIAEHNLGNFISLVNLDIYAGKILGTAEKIRDNCYTTNKSIAKLSIVDYVKLFGFAVARKVFAADLIFRQFYAAKVEYTEEMHEYLNRLNQVKEDIINVNETKENVSASAEKNIKIADLKQSINAFLSDKQDKKSKAELKNQLINTYGSLDNLVKDNPLIDMTEKINYYNCDWHIIKYTDETNIISLKELVLSTFNKKNIFEADVKEDVKLIKKLINPNNPYHLQYEDNSFLFALQKRFNSTKLMNLI